MSKHTNIPLDGKLVLLGAGKMGGAMLQGWLEAGISPGNIVIYDPAPSGEIARLIDDQKISLNPDVASLENVEIILAAVKPQIMESALAAILPLKSHHPLILSIAAGKTIAGFEAAFGKDAAIIRSIPNTPSAIGQGITAISANANVSDDQMQLASSLLSSIGEVVTVADEGQIDAVTGLSGSGPAYVFYLTECLARAGIDQGLDPDLAMSLARATVSGAGALMKQTGIDAATLRKNVTSPNGTTFAGLNVLMADDGLQPLVSKTVKAATERSRELAS